MLSLTKCQTHHKTYLQQMPHCEPEHVIPPGGTLLENPQQAFVGFLSVERDGIDVGEEVGVDNDG